MNPTAARLRSLLRSSLAAWRALTESDAAAPLAPGKWSRKELLGHLVDSASNNHQRFVRAQFQGDLVFLPYAQDDWVRVQRYAERPLVELVDLWRAMNEHVAHVIEHTPREIAERPHERHNLDQVAFRELPDHQPATLAWFHADYVEHLEHHLRQAGVA